MRCPTCSQENPETNWFCSRCLGSLRRQALEQQRKRRVFIPSYLDHYHRSRPKRHSGAGGWLVVIALVAGILYWLYGQGSGI